jgi:hypothetical protein
MKPLLAIFLAVASSISIFGLGLQFVGWLFRREEPDRWRCMSARRAQNAVLGLFATIGPPALVGLLRTGWINVVLFIVIPPVLGVLFMGTLWGRLNHGKPKGGPIDPEI